MDVCDKCKCGFESELHNYVDAGEDYFQITAIFCNNCLNSYNLAFLIDEINKQYARFL